MADPLTWGNPEKQLLRWLIAHTTSSVYTQTPGDLVAHLPALKVERVGGSRINDHTRDVYFEIEVFASTRGAMWDAVSELEYCMRELSANGTADWYVDNITEVFSAAVIPYENPGICRATSTYVVALRPRIK